MTAGASRRSTPRPGSPTHRSIATQRCSRPSRRSSGDFLCAPFCASDVEAGPLHGWTANAPWKLTAQSAGPDTAEATYTLSQPVMGAEVTKRFRLRAGEPFLYVAHQFTGGGGQHPGQPSRDDPGDGEGRDFLFAEGRWCSPATQPPESDPARGRSLLTYPWQGTDIGAVPLAAGGTIDVRTYPVAQRHEDVVELIEAPTNTLGWTAVVREAEDDVVLLLKDSRVLPQTTLWMSNGGRDYAPLERAPYRRARHRGRPQLRRCRAPRLDRAQLPQPARRPHRLRSGRGRHHPLRHRRDPAARGLEPYRERERSRAIP